MPCEPVNVIRGHESFRHSEVSPLIIAEGKPGIIISCLIVSLKQPGVVISTNCTVWSPLVVNRCAGFLRLDILAGPLPGSSKFHQKR